MQIKCVIVDDEPMARKGLRRYVEKVDFLTLIGECEDAMQLNTLLQRESPDLLFLDIEMPYLSGLDLLKSLTVHPHVIITSAYEKYALKGYDLDVTDYLLKPISFERFLKAVNKVQSQLSQQEALEKHDEANDDDECDYIFVRADKRMHKIYFKDILFVEGVENYVNINLEDSKLLVRSTMKHILEVLPSNQFMQVHKSFVVNQNKIEMIEGNQIVIGNRVIAVARNFRNEVFERILKNTL